MQLKNLSLELDFSFNAIEEINNRIRVIFSETEELNTRIRVCI